jgi:hypothetical protein
MNNRPNLRLDYLPLAIALPDTFSQTVGFEVSTFDEFFRKHLIPFFVESIDRFSIKKEETKKSYRADPIREGLWVML